jgi:hypothetical protein
LRNFPSELPFIWDEVTLHNGTVFTLDADLGIIDLPAEASGAGSFAEVRKNAVLIALDPHRLSWVERPEIMIEGERTYHLDFSRNRVKGERVNRPRHLLQYRHLNERVIEVGRILDDSRDLVRNLPGSYRLIG